MSRMATYSWFWAHTSVVRVHGYSRSFFFFQAEDGIRDGRVTGVQTCALPISRAMSSGGGVAGAGALSSPAVIFRITSARSEERRVGKECRSRWSPYH